MPSILIWIKMLSRGLFLLPGLGLYFMLLGGCYIAWSRELPVCSRPPECHKHQPTALYSLWLWLCQARELCSFAAQWPPFKVCCKYCIGLRLQCSAEMWFLQTQMLRIRYWLQDWPVDPSFFSTSSFTWGRVPRLSVPADVSSSHRQLTPPSVYRKYSSDQNF